MDYFIFDSVFTVLIVISFVLLGLSLIYRIFHYGFYVPEPKDDKSDSMGKGSGGLDE